MWAVDRRIPLREHDLLLVRAEGIAGTEDELPPVSDPACGGAQVVPAVALVELGAFAGGVTFGLVEDDLPLADQSSAIGAHLDDAELVLDPAARVGVRVDEIRLAILIPERAGVDEALAFEQAPRLAPLSARVGRGGDVDPFIRQGEEDPEQPRMFADGGRPDAAAVLGKIEHAARVGVVFDRVVDDGPVHQVAGMEDRQPRRAVEAGRGEPEVLTVADHIRVGIVGAEDRVGVGPVATIGRPRVGTGWWMNRFR